ncbi:MAG: VWA domain-containing protein [Planctomycetaceae bacterium]|nr:VWA domain-containing protein [Planctomycetaceae bacterium]
MSLAYPFALILSVIALPIIALYILKVRLRRVPVSTNLFWKQIYEEKPPRSIWQQFRHLLSLLLQLLMLLLLMLAVADPYFSWQLLQARRIVLIIDNSASMRAADVSPSRLEAAKREAQNIVNGLRFRDQAAVVLAGETPEVLIGMTGHVPTLREVISNVAPSDLPTELNSAIALGRQLVGDQAHGQVVVLSDVCVNVPAAVDKISGEEAAASDLATDVASTALPATEDKTASTAAPEKKAEVEVQYRVFGTDSSNLGITQFQARRSLIDPVGYEILVSVQNSSFETITCRLELSLDDIPVDVVPLKLKPEEKWSRSFEKTSLEGGRLKAEITQVALQQSDPSATEKSSVVDSKSPESSGTNATLDALATDNVAWALLPGRKVQNVLIVTPGNLFLQKVFEANPLVNVSVVKEFPTGNQWPANSIVVLHGKVPEKIPDGNVLVIDPASGCDLWELGDVLENPLVTDQDKDSPLMNHIRLDNVLFPEARLLKYKSPVHSLAKTISGEDVYSQLNRPSGKCLVLSVNLDRSDLAFRTAFPIMVANALGWFSGTTGELQTSVATGSLAPLTVPLGKVPGPDPKLSGTGRYVSLFNPSGKAVQVPVSVDADGDLESGTIIAGPLNEPGIWTVQRGDAAPSVAVPTGVTSIDDNQAENVLTSIAVNLASERETDLRPNADLVALQSKSSIAENWFSRPLWYYLAFIAVVLTCVEWFLFHRRFIA